MDESNAIRAITIGVSTFIAIMTISAVMMYYNTARDAVNAIGTGTDIAQNYSAYIRDILLKPSGVITGADVKNILNYYYMDEKVSITMGKFTKMGSEKNSIVPYETTSIVNRNLTEYNTVTSNIIDANEFKINVSYYDSDNVEVKEIKIEEN